MKNKKITTTAVAFIVALITGIVIHKLFLNLEFETLRSLIVAVGVAAWWYLYKQKK